MFLCVCNSQVIGGGATACAHRRPTLFMEARSGHRKQGIIGRYVSQCYHHKIAKGVCSLVFTVIAHGLYPVIETASMTDAFQLMVEFLHKLQP